MVSSLHLNDHNILQSKFNMRINLFIFRAKRIEIRMAGFGAILNNKEQFILLCITEFIWTGYAGHLYFYGGKDAKVGWTNAKVKHRYFEQLGRICYLQISNVNIRFGKFKRLLVDLQHQVSLYIFVSHLHFSWQRFVHEIYIELLFMQFLYFLHNENYNSIVTEIMV